MVSDPAAGAKKYNFFFFPFQPQEPKTICNFIVTSTVPETGRLPSSLRIGLARKDPTPSPDKPCQKSRPGPLYCQSGAPPTELSGTYRDSGIDRGRQVERQSGR